MLSIWIYFKMQFIPVIKAKCSASLLQYSVSRGPLEIILIWWFAFQEKITIIIIIINI